MKGYPLVYLLAVVLAVVCISAQAAYTGVPMQTGAVQVQGAPPAATAVAPAACCCAVCPREAEKKPKPWWSLDPALGVALIGLVGAWAKYLYDRRVRRKTLNIIILAEIARLLGVADSHYGWWWDRAHKKDTDQQLIPFTTPIFDSQLANLGDLDRRYAGDIVRFYGYVKFLNTKQETQVFYHKKHKPSEFDFSYRGSLNSFLNEYKTRFDEAFEAYGIQKPELKEQAIRREREQRKER